MKRARPFLPGGLLPGLLAGLLLIQLATSHAAPAPWYQWRSKVDATLACAQTTLGPGWVRESGPYRDSRCEKLVLAK